MRSIKKIIVMMLVFCMMVSVVPVDALAEEEKSTLTSGNATETKTTTYQETKKELKLDKTTLTLKVGEEETLTATLDGASAEGVTWSSSDTAVATVDNGVVTAVTVGTATITVSTEDVTSATCTVTVEKATTPDDQKDDSEIATVSELVQATNGNETGGTGRQRTENYVAQIGDNKYRTLADAIDVANNGDTVVLIDDITVSSKIVLDQSLSLDLNGYTVTNNVEQARMIEFGGQGIELSIRGTASGSQMVIPESNNRSWGFIRCDYPECRITIEGGTYTGKTDNASLINTRYSNVTFTGEQLNDPDKWTSVYVRDAEMSSDFRGMDIRIANELVIDGGSYETTGGVQNDGTKISVFFLLSMVSKGEISNATVASSKVDLEASSSVVELYNNNFQATSGWSGAVTATNIGVSGGGYVYVDGGTYEIVDNGNNTDAGSSLWVYNTGGTIEAVDGTFVGTRAVLKADSSKGVKSKIYVSGGNYTGEIQLSNQNCSLEVTGGTFSDDPTNYADADLYNITKTDVNKWTVAEKPNVAEINGVKYKSLEKAVNNAPNNATIILLNDANVQESITINNRNITIDLNGKNVNAPEITSQLFSIKNGSLKVTGKGKLESKGDIFRLEGNIVGLDSDRDSKKAEVYIDKDVEVISTENCCIYIIGKGAKADVFGNLRSLGVYATIQGNGSHTENNNRSDTIINIYSSATVTQEKGMAIYHPQYGILNITGGTIVGKTTGIEIRAGRLIVNGGTITGQGEFKIDSNDNGSTTEGVAVAVSQHTTDLPTTVVIEGGTFNAEKGRAVYIKDVQNNVAQGEVSVTINGGVFNSAVEKVSNDSKLTITGGKFSSVPASDYLKSGYETKINGNYYEVGEHNLQAVAGKAATCTTAGTKSHYKCSFCGKLYSDAAGNTEVTSESLVIPATGNHTYGSWTVTKAATCGAKGTEQHKCSVCGKTETRDIAATGNHNYGGWKLASKPTCTSAGSNVSVCSVCGHERYSSIEKTSHSYGSNGKCTVCGDYDATKVAAPAAPVEVIPAPTTPATKPATTQTTTTTTTETETTTAPVENAKPETADTTITKVEASVEVVEAVKETVKVEEGTAKVETETIEKVIEATEEGKEVVLPLTQVTEEVVNKAEVPAEALEKIAEKEADVVIQLTEITVKLDAAAVAAVTEQAPGKNIEIRAVKTETATLTETQQEALVDKETAIVVTAQIFADGEYIGDFKGGTATIMLPFTPEEGKAAEDYKVYFIGDDGSLTEVAAEYVDGHMVFTTGHFSDYAIVYEKAEAVEETDSEEEVVLTPEEEVSEGSSLPIIPIVVVIAIIVIVGIFLVMRKKNEEE